MVIHECEVTHSKRSDHHRLSLAASNAVPKGADICKGKGRLMETRWTGCTTDLICYAYKWRPQFTPRRSSGSRYGVEDTPSRQTLAYDGHSTFLNPRPSGLGVHLYQKKHSKAGLTLIEQVPRHGPIRLERITRDPTPGYRLVSQRYKNHVNRETCTY